MKYEIPDDVLVERVTGDRITFGAYFISLPLYAITGGGGGGCKVLNEPLPPMLLGAVQPHTDPGLGEHLAHSLLGNEVGQVEQPALYLG